MNGLIIGKFCPPHRGHKLLIDTGLAETDGLTVLVCDSASDPLPIDLRLAWLREIHPKATFKAIHPDTFDRNDAHAWITATREQIAEDPDVIFSSEDYGNLYAELLGCRHRMVDQERVAVPCSGFAILNDPMANLQFLEPCVRDYFTKQA